MDRVYFYDTGGELVCLPAEWTDAVPADPFVVAADPFVVAAGAGCRSGPPTCWRRPP